jgi:hypothetical protein
VHKSAAEILEIIFMPPGKPFRAASYCDLDLDTRFQFLNLRLAGLNPSSHL